MPKYEVESVFRVVADNPDDAVTRLRRVLDTVQITLESGVRGYSILDDAVTEAGTKGA